MIIDDYIEFSFVNCTGPKRIGFFQISSAMANILSAVTSVLTGKFTISSQNIKFRLWCVLKLLFFVLVHVGTITVMYFPCFS